MTRLPQIGDHVWRVVDGKTVFDGYVAVSGDSGTVGLVRSEAPMQTHSIETSLAAPDDDSCERHYRMPLSAFVSKVALVRQLHGWRWVPHDLRPEVKPGDMLTLTRPDGAVYRYLILDSQGEPGIAYRPLDVPSATHAGFNWIGRDEAANALAGLDGWSWEPARWPGEPKGAP